MYLIFSMRKKKSKINLKMIKRGNPILESCLITFSSRMRGGDEAWCVYDHMTQFPDMTER